VGLINAPLPALAQACLIACRREKRPPATPLAPPRACLPCPKQAIERAHNNRACAHAPTLRFEVKAATLQQKVAALDEKERLRRLRMQAMGAQASAATCLRSGRAVSKASTSPLLAVLQQVGICHSGKKTGGRGPWRCNPARTASYVAPFGPSLGCPRPPHRLRRTQLPVPRPTCPGYFSKSAVKTGGEGAEKGEGPASCSPVFGQSLTPP